jgi:two-component system response regulator BaeR
MGAPKPQHVLVVEDEAKIAALLRDYFEQAGFAVDVLGRGDEVEAFVARTPPELLILDLQLPGKDGLEVCRALRARGGGRPAILMLTARVEEVDRLLGLELGADDYVCKPFSPREIVARAKAILRRLEPHSAGGVTRIGTLALDRTQHKVTVGSAALTLTPIEFALLEAMVEQPHRVWSRGQLLERCKGTDFAGYERNIDGHVKNLRAKLREALPERAPIRSVYGVGYGLESGEFSA